MKLNTHLFRSLTFLGFSLFSLSSALASTGEIYGYGSRAGSMGNTVMGGANSAFATFYNPAINSTHPGLHLTLGFSWAKPSFKEINNVVVANSATSSRTSEDRGDINTSDYLNHFGQALGASFNLGRAWKDLTVGFTSFLPIERFAYLDTGEPFKPEYFSYRARTQRPQIYASLSARLFDWLSLSGGVAFSTNVAAKADIMTSSADSSVSYSRFSTTMKPGAAPYGGFFLDFFPFQTGVTVRAPNKYEMTLDTSAVARVFGPANSVDLVFTSSSTLFYDPLELDLAFSYDIESVATQLVFEVDWLNYKRFESPALSVQDKSSTAALKSSVTNLPEMQDIIVPKIGIEHEFESWIARAGYFWRPSPVKSNSGTGNLVDPEKHVFTGGIGFDLAKLNITQKQIFLDLHGQYHWLVEQEIKKTPGNEAGNLNQSKVGSPGYNIGGRVISAGFAVSMAF